MRSQEQPPSDRVETRLRTRLDQITTQGYEAWNIAHSKGTEVALLHFNRMLPSLGTVNANYRGQSFLDYHVAEYIAAATRAQATTNAAIFTPKREMEILVRVGNAAVPALLPLLNYTNINVRHYCAMMLGEIGTNTAVPALIASLLDPTAEPLPSVPEALGMIGSAEAVPALLRLFQHENHSVQSSVAYALGLIGSDTVLNGLKALLIEENLNDAVRESALIVLGRVRSDVAVDLLSEQFSKVSPHLRARIVEALGNIGSEGAIRELRRLHQASDKSMGPRILYALSHIGSADAIDALLTIVTAQDSSIVNIGEALSRVRSASALPSLMKALDTNQAPLQLGALDAIEAMQNIGSELDVPALLKFIQEDHEDDIRSRVASILGRFGSADTVHSLLSINTRDANLRRYLAKSLEEVRCIHAVPSLIDALSSVHTELRIGAIVALGEIGSADALVMLEAQGHRSVGDERFYANQAMQKIFRATTDKREAEAILSNRIEALQSTDDSVRGGAVIFLRNQAPDRLREILMNTTKSGAVHALFRSSKHMDVGVRRSAAYLLGRLQAELKLRLFEQKQEPTVATIAQLAYGEPPIPRDIYAALEDNLATQLSRLSVNEWEIFLSQMSKETYAGLDQALQQFKAKKPGHQ